MFDLSIGSTHGKDDVAGHIFTCRPDDPGRDGIVTLGLWPRREEPSAAQSKTPMHVFQLGFRVTNLHDYQRLPLAWTMEQVVSHLSPLVRAHFEIQLVLFVQDRPWELRINGIDWR